MKTKAIVTCSKIYPEFPFAHRQHKHDGHCALIHGHNWSFKLTFGADRLDENEFVVDFGKLKFIKAWLDSKFDHTLVLNEDDPHLHHFVDSLLAKPKSIKDEPCKLFAKIVAVPNCGAEGLAKWVFECLTSVLILQGPQDWINRNVRIVSVEVFEDSKNSALYYKETVNE
jgi:6-pyruvoyltetrahydropterin/6-carboxytetrahydropterin synthase